jgi:hypothetical protein
MNPAYQKITGSYNRTIIVGDIHGCFDELKTLLGQIKFNSDDLLVAVGDLVDRGPCSWDVANFFKQTPNAYSVLGNHERRSAGVIRGSSQPAWSQLHTLSKMSEIEHGAWADYFESLPAVIETPHAVITHARIDPDEGITEQEAYHTCAVGGARIHTEVDDDGIPVWFHHWKASCDAVKPICIGHIGYTEVELEENGLYALDTGAVKGGQLTAVVFPGAAVVSVDCRDYYVESRAEWGEQEFSRRVEGLRYRPINEMIRLLHTESHDNYDTALLHEFELMLVEYDFVCRATAMREGLVIRFGPRPEAASERVAYFRTIREEFTTSQYQRLLGMLLTDGTFQLEKLIKVFQKSSLEEVASIYSIIEQWLRNEFQGIEI